MRHDDNQSLRLIGVILVFPPLLVSVSCSIPSSGRRPICQTSLHYLSAHWQSAHFTPFGSVERERERREREVVETFSHSSVVALVLVCVVDDLAPSLSFVARNSSHSIRVELHAIDIDAIHRNCNTNKESEIEGLEQRRNEERVGVAARACVVTPLADELKLIRQINAENKETHRICHAFIQYRRHTIFHCIRCKYPLSRISSTLPSLDLIAFP